MKFGDNTITFPKCGSNDVSRKDIYFEYKFEIHSILVFLLILNFADGTFVTSLAVGGIIGSLILIYNMFKKQKGNIWEMKCHTCLNMFDITDPTLNNKSENIKSKCENCGAEIRDVDNFCSSCGNKIN